MAGQDIPHALSSKIAQLLGEVIIHHAPWSSEISEQTRRRIADDWLENLEQHTKGNIAPLMAAFQNMTDAPPEIASLLEKVADPSAQFGSLMQQFFVFGLMFTLANSMLAPFVQAVQNDIWKANPDRPLAPPDLATMVVRGIDLGDSGGVAVPDWAVAMAGESGVNAQDFASMVGINGMPPDMTTLFEAVRRKVIDDAQLEQALKQGDLRDEWIPYVMKLRYVQPTPVDMVRAAVQNQVEPAKAEQLAYELGLEPPGYVNGNPSWWQILYDSAGRPPGPQEMGRAANRGIIEWSGTGPDATTFQQAISESDLKNKWEPILKALAVYQPPNGDIKTMLMHGGIDAEQAMALWQANGVTPEIAKAYAYLAEHEQITQDKALAKGDILTLVQEGSVSDEVAEGLLANIGYSGQNAQWLVQMAHFRYNLEALRAGVRQVEKLYTAHKTTAAGAKSSLMSLGVPDAQATALLTAMDVERAAEVPTFTAAQIASGLYYGIIDQSQAMSMLQDLGWQPWDAWYVLSLRMHGPLPDQPGAPDTLPPVGVTRQA